MRELNKLTEHLLWLGYTKENPPEGYRPWNDLYGGWEYSAKQERNMIVEAPCGTVSLASNIVGSMGYANIDWCLENDNAIMRCPFGKIDCEQNHPLLKNMHSEMVMCAVKIIDREFDYELSAEAIEERNRQNHEEAIKAFARTQDHFCRQHLCYDKYTNKFWIDFHPIYCGNCSYCTMIKEKIEGPKGNAFYDLKIRRLIDGYGFVPSEWKTNIIKGIRLFEKNKSLKWCEICALPEHRRDIERKVKDKYFTELHFAKYHGKGFEYEILNVRAEKRESRDIDQDLEDIANGCSITHMSDMLAAEKDAKRERRAKAKDKKVQRLLKLCETTDYASLPEGEKIRVKKAIAKGDFSFEDVIKARKTKANTPQQLSLFEEE